MPYFITVIAIEALIRTLKWHVKIRNMLDRFGIFAIFVATLLGIINPLSACVTLVVIISLLAGGLTLAPAMAFLVSSPLISLTGYSITVNMLGPEWAYARVGAAVFMGLFAGFVTHIIQEKWFKTHELFREKLPEGNFHDPDYIDDRLKCFYREQLSNRLAIQGHNKLVIYFAKMYEGFKKIAIFILIAVVIGAVFDSLTMMFLQHEWFMSVLESNNILIVPAISVAAIPLDINQMTVISFLWGYNDMLIEAGKTMNKGVGLAFLVGGPVTALPAMVLFLALFKKRVFFFYIALCVTGTLICAYLYQLLS